MLRGIFFALLMLAFMPSAHAESGYEHVMKTRTLRCAYATLPPYISVDPASHQISGLLYDITNEIGSRLDLKVEWVEEAGYGDIAEGIKAGRYDAFCGVLWQTPARAGAMSFSAPLYKNKVSPCVRGDTSAYDTSTDALNAPDKTMAGYDGDVSIQTARQIFPKAKTIALPANMSFGEALQNIVTKKIDAIATCDRIIVDDFNKNNQGALKVAAPDKPITQVQVALALPLGDAALKNMTDTAIYEMTADKTMEKLIRKYLDKYIDDPIVLNKP